MRKLILFAVSIALCGSISAQTLAPPIDFESMTITYTWTDFDGGGTTVIPNPQVSGINTSATVGQMIKSPGQVWGGSTIEMTNPIDFTTNKIFKMKVYSPFAGARVLLKVENSTNGGIFFEKEDTSTVANAWEELTFDFTAINTADSYQKIVLIWELGVMGDGTANSTYLFDDIELIAPVLPPLTQIDLPVTFEDPLVDYTMTDFGGNTATVITDPVNPPNLVSEVVKDATAQLWAGTTVSTPLGFANPIPFTVSATTMSVRVWSPDAGIPIRLKAEDHTNPTISVETETMTTVAGQWETLVFDFSNEVVGTAAINVANTYDMASIFFDFGTDGATNGTKTYYFDDVMFGQGVVTLAQIDLPVTFEDPLVDYTMTDFGGNTATVITDPVNPPNLVSEVVKDATAQLWAGTTVSTPLGFANPIPFTVSATTMSVLVWSPDAGIPIRLKAEDHTNPTISVETETMTTVAGQWETLVFDFSNEAAGTAVLNVANTYDMASIFFDFGTDGATNGTKTYYFDDVMFGQPAVTLAQIDLPVTFEDPLVDYTMTDFGGNTATVITDPVNPPNLVSEVVKDATAQLWAGTTVSTPLGFANPIPFTVSATTMSVLVWSPDAGIPIRLKAEDHTNPTISVETETMTTVAGQWETLVFDFSNEAAGTAVLNVANTYDMASIFFDFGTDGATNGTKTYYFDDVMFGQPAVPLAQIDLAVTFEDPLVDYTMTDFGGNTATVITDPVNPPNLVSEVVKDATAQLWAGTTVSTSLGFANAIPFTATETKMSVSVWSPDAGIPIRLKAEDHTNPTISVETETMTTVAGQWETLVFDFSNEATGTAALNITNTYDMASIFFDFGTDGATNGTKTYYFDDVQMALPCTTTTSSITETGVDVYTGPSGATYTTSGIHHDTIPNAEGCDSIIEIDLTLSFTGIKEYQLGSIELYPNPATESITISVNELFLAYPIMIMDQAGRVVIKSEVVELETEIDITKLESGIYYVKIGDLKAEILVKQ
ncbi:MAG: hypothetical protein ACJASQ_000033 [Crocinitomicaceae bacterium]|jgi:hypothetical protein